MKEEQTDRSVSHDKEETMHKLFVSGDQRLDPMTSYEIVFKLANKLLARSMERGIPLSDVQFITGNSTMGIERAMRYLYADVTPLFVINYPIGRDGRPDYHSAFEAIEIDHAILLDHDPLGSPLIRAALDVYGDEKVHLVLDKVLAD